MVAFADKTKKKRQIDQVLARGIERQKRALKLNCIDKFSAPALAVAAAAAAAAAADVTPSTDDELIEIAIEGIAALKAAQPVGAYAVLGLIITELHLRKQKQ